MRFSLRTILATVAATAIVMMVLMHLTTDYREQLAIRSDLKAMGAYAVSFGPDNSIQASFHDPVASPEIGKYREIAVLDFKEAHVTDESLSHLVGLEKVGVIIFSLSDVRDDQLVHLGAIGEVRHLWLAHTGLTDACVDAIIDLPGLESVDVTNSSMTQAGISRLLEARPSLIVRDRSTR